MQQIVCVDCWSNSREVADSTMRKWKCFFVNDCKCKSAICTAAELFVTTLGQILSKCSEIMSENIDDSKEQMRNI